MIAVVAEESFGDCVNFLYVLILTGIITWIECYLAKVLAKRNFSENMQVPASKLEEPGIDMSANDRDVKEMINEIFGGEKNV